MTHEPARAGVAQLRDAQVAASSFSLLAWARTSYFVSDARRIGSLPDRSSHSPRIGLAELSGCSFADLVGDGANGFGQLRVGVGSHQHVGAVAQEISGGADLADIAGVADHVRRCSVPEAVRRETRHSCPGHEPVEGLVEVAWRHRRAGSGSDDEVVVDPLGPAANRSSAWNRRCPRSAWAVAGSIGMVLLDRAFFPALHSGRPWTSTKAPLNADRPLLEVNC